MAWHVDYLNSEYDDAYTSSSGRRIKAHWTRDHAGPYATREEAKARATYLKKGGAKRVRITQRWTR